MIKIFGVGNILLCDDGIGVKVVKSLRKKLKDFKENIEVIIGETDYMYCLNQVKDDDFVIIVDSTNFMIKPGKVSKITLEDCDKFLFIDNQYYISSHEESLLRILRMEKRNIKGYLLGIEIDKIQYSDDLSKKIKDIYEKICNNIYQDILDIIKENIYLINKSI